MNAKVLGAAIVAVPLALGGIAVNTAPVQSDQQQSAEEGYLCPVTGETLPCEGCCVLNQQK